jgi:hypothetical protein
VSISTPTPQTVRSVIGGLFDKDLNIEALPPSSFNAHDPMTIAVYANDEGKPQALFLCDVGLAAHAAAALVMLPVAKSQTCADGGYIDDELLENYHEVVNVGAGMFVDSSGGRVTLRELIAPGSPLPRDIRPLLVMPAGRATIEMGIEGYGRGRMLMHCA